MAALATEKRTIAMTIRLTLLCLPFFAALPACAMEPPPAFESGAGEDRIGRIYHYERSDIDGSEAEQIYMYRESRDKVLVYKMRNKCTNAAHVTAWLDFDQMIASRLTGGRLAPNAQYEDFISADYDSHLAELTITVPGDEPLVRTLKIGHTPWHIFDFDFASLNAMTPHLARPQKGFTIGLPMLWADITRDDFLVYLGELDAAFVANDEKQGAPARRYRLAGSALKGGEGALWLDRHEGHIIEATLPIPNHREHKDFKLSLISIDDGGPDAWRKLLTAHFEGCGEEE